MLRFSLNSGCGLESCRMGHVMCWPREQAQQPMHKITALWVNRTARSGCLTGGGRCFHGGGGMWWTGQPAKKMAAQPLEILISVRLDQCTSSGLPQVNCADSSPQEVCVGMQSVSSCPAAQTQLCASCPTGKSINHINELHENRFELQLLQSFCEQTAFGLEFGQTGEPEMHFRLLWSFAAETSGWFDFISEVSNLSPQGHTHLSPADNRGSHCKSCIFFMFLNGNKVLLRFRK